MAVNPNGAWLLNVASVRGHNVSSPSRSPKNTVKNQFDFLKVYNELGKVMKFWTSRPLFHGEIAICTLLIFKCF